VPVIATVAVAAQSMSFEGDTDGAIQMMDRAGDAADDSGDPFQATWARLQAALFTALRDGGEGARARVESLRGDVEQLGSGVMHASWLLVHAVVALQEDPELGLSVCDELVATATRARLPEMLHSVQFFAGIARARLGQTSRAGADLRRSLAGYQDTGNRRGVTNVLDVTAALAARTGRAESASQLLAGLRAVRGRHGIAGSAIEQLAEQRTEERLRRALGDETFASVVVPRDAEATIDLALDVLTEIAATEDS